MRVSGSANGASRAMRHFRFLAVGNAVSSYGSYLNMVALNLFAYHLTGSALQTGLFMALRLGASFLTGLLAGSAVSRLDRKRVMVTADSTQAVAMVVLVLAPVATQSTLLYAIATITGICGTLSSVALRSSIPEIVGADRRVRANALLVTGRSLAMVAGFASAGLVIATLGYTAAFIINALTFAFAALNLARLPISTRRTAAEPAADGTAGEAGAKRESLLGAQLTAFRFLKAAPILLAMIGLRAIDGFGSASHNVGLPVLSSSIDPGNPAAFMSQFWTVWAIGSILAQRAVAWWSKRSERSINERAFAIGAIVMSLAFILAFTTPPLIFGILVALLAGVADGFTEIAYTSRLQTAPDEQRGYVFGFSAMAENFGFGGGMVLCAALMERMSPLAVVAIFHGLAIVLALAFLAVLVLRRRGRGTAGPTETEKPARTGDPVPEPAGGVPEVVNRPTGPTTERSEAGAAERSEAGT
ncbi:MFS transporter [Polymorphospora sp. NPDC050346]|uniref:MFS transporter n=1 Tax=Polymorphospora sp. NPDC050346 TaxID=3155780 RepID=UPI0033C72EC5